jgi:hypothetical protein
MSEFNFSNVKAREVQTGLVGEYPISELENLDGSVPILKGVFAGEKNRKLRAAVMALNAKRGRGRRKMSDDAILLAARENVRSLFPPHVLRGWENVIDGDFEPVEFSVDASEAYLRAIPDYILQGIIEYFGDPLNFAGSAPAPTPEEVDETAGN